MRTKKFFASAAKAVFALAAVLMMSTAFTACSSDKSDDPTPEPKFTNTVTLDDVGKPIIRAEYDNEGDGNYRIYFPSRMTEMNEWCYILTKTCSASPSS